jgi:hypothetical protein
MEQKQNNVEKRFYAIACKEIEGRVLYLYKEDKINNKNDTGIIWLQVSHLSKIIKIPHFRTFLKSSRYCSDDIKSAGIVESEDQTKLFVNFISKEGFEKFYSIVQKKEIKDNCKGVIELLSEYEKDPNSFTKL